MSASPVISPMLEQGINANDSDGAYYVISGDYVQVVIVGAMHFTPGEYMRALNDLVETHFELHTSSFMMCGNENAKRVLDRGFVSLIGRKEN